jgi:hypothetical protein
MKQKRFMSEFRLVVAQSAKSKEDAEMKLRVWLARNDHQGSFSDLTYVVRGAIKTEKVLF